ncbi:C2 domain protein [Pseudohyphozyma bogoriensis]|nr:C2 domain protein [Pseudohyphozyma bogoriensis]
MNFNLPSVSQRTAASAGSGSGSTASSAVPREDSDVYHYALRVAVLAANTSQSSAPTAAVASSSSATAPASSPQLSTSTNGGTPTLRSLSSFKPADGWTKSLFSLHEVFKDSGGKNGASTKFPKDFVKVLDARMLRVINGNDPNYSPDPLFTSTIRAFQAKFAEPSFQRRIKVNRQTEELILTFGTTSSGLLKREFEGDEWKAHLDEQVGVFMRFVRDVLRSKDVKGVPTELLMRLDAHCAKLDASGTGGGSSTASPMAGGIGGRGPAPESSMPPPIPGLTTNVVEMEMVMAVGKLFGKSVGELQRDVIAMRRSCTEKAAYNDLKLCINRVAQGARFPARREDFDSDDGFQAWKKQESAELSEMIFEMVSKDPSLRNSGPPESTPPIRNGGGSARNSVIGLTSPSPEGSVVGSSGGEDENVSEGFTFVPPDPKFYYKRLFEIALDYDYDMMSQLPPDEYVSLTILSNVNEALLRDCATRWRIIPPVRASTFLSLIVQHYKHQGVPEACVGEALSGLDRVEAEWEYDRWPWADRRFLFKNLRALFDILLSRFWEIFEGILDLPFDEVVDSLTRIWANQVFREDARDVTGRLDELRVGMRKWVQFAYEEKQADVDSLERENDLQPFISMLVWITGETKAYQKQFPDPVVGAIDVPAIFVGVAAPEFVRHLDASRNALLAAASQAPGAAGDEDLLGLYRGVVKLQQMHKAYCPENPLTIDFSRWFEPYVKRWLVTTDTKTMEWVRRAIASDKFEPEVASEDMHSTSIVDLIASCKSAADFILALDWPNEYENARYLTGLSQTIAKSIEQYSNHLEGLFMEEMFPRRSAEHGDTDANRPSAWLTKAKLAVQGDKKVEPFIFRPETLVKLNNIQAARKLLDRMYTTLDADRVAKILEINAPPVPATTNQPQRFLFTVKIVLSENLFGSDGTVRKKLDPFCILSDHVGHRVAKTRTLYETNDPRWDETFDVSVKGDLWLRATVYNRNLVEDHDIVGRAYIHLNPAEFNDFLTRDVWLQLEDTSERKLESRLLLRISMEGEKDDIQFFFGRAFRSLKRAENDMARSIVDKMSPFVRNYISQHTLKGLVKKSYNFDIDLDRVRGDLTKATGKINALVREALTVNQDRELIPDVHDYRNRVEAQKVGEKRKVRVPLTDAEIEDAIGPLFDYFNDTFRVLATTLSTEAWELVSSRLWKDILTTIESLIVPPLSDQPTEMRPLAEKELDVVFKWLQFLVDFFYQRGEGLPLSTLKNQKYQELGMARMYYDWAPDLLCEEAVRARSVLARSKSVYNQRNIGTIKARKVEKAQSEGSNVEIILRLLRMHPGQGDFIRQQINVLSMASAPPPSRNSGSLQRRTPAANGAPRGHRGRGGVRSSGAPALPPIPDAYQS